MNAIKIKDKYQNLHAIKMEMSAKRLKSMAKDYISKKDAIPPFKIPRVKIDKEKFEKQNSFVWLGHSTILANLDGVKFIVDPMLSLRASPLKCVGPKRFEGSLTPIEELPKLDFILITHNHYDHLDKDTLQVLEKSVEHIFVPLDNKQKLIKWGINEEKIKEFDWFESFTCKDVTFTFCPTQHFSGRDLKDRDKALWGSWAIRGSNKIYISGDSGYNEHFRQIAQKLGCFDIACMECGAYNENWSEIHMLPEESVQASLDLKASVMLPMHWAGFDLSTHAWDEPIERALKKAKSLHVKTTTPLIGEIINFDNPIINKKWWRDI